MKPGGVGNWSWNDMEAMIVEMRDLLLRFEWHRADGSSGDALCYYCGAKQRNGHLPNCELAKALTP